ncbi:MAG TPA: DUF5702 domain-containing protein [Pseudobacteroides sp.]|uniref:DUF5702 domain-containing protein n=1 Tax=Pseudobacteroides sp. TaxID=1968840 RepID=UPI002F95B59A
MDFLKKTQGAISIFLCFVLLALVALSGSLVDGSRMRVAEAETKTAIDCAAMSQLTYYNNVLKELYGLFAMADNDPATIREAISKNLDERLLYTVVNEKKEGFEKYYSEVKGLFEKDKSKPLNFFDFKAEEIKVNPLYNLSEGEVFKRQILEFMKYRAPKEIADQFLDKLLAFKDLGEQTRMLEKKLDIDEKLYKAGEGTETLSDKALEINSLAKSSSIDKKLDSLTQSVSDRIKAQKLLWEKKKQLESMTPPVNSSDDPKAVKKHEENLKAYAKSVESLSKEIEKFENLTIPQLKRDASKIKDDLIRYIDTELIGNKAFNDALNAIDDIKEKSKEVVNMANELSVAIKEDSSSFGEAIRTDLKSKKQVLDTKVLDDRNLEIEKCRSTYTEIKRIVADIHPDSIVFDVVSSLPEDLESKVRSGLSYEKVGKLLKDIPRVNYYVKKTEESEGSADDPRTAIKAMREDVEKDGNKLIEEIKKGDEKTKDMFPEKGLPSQGEIKDSLKELKDLISTDIKKVQDRGKSNSGSNLFNPDYKGISSFEKNLDFKDNNVNKSKEALSVLKGLTGIISSGLKNLRDELYVGEYSLGMFKNAVTEKLDLNGDIQYDLTGYKMSTRKDTFFERAELEYILNGSRSQEQNLLWIKGQILLVRWALNTVSIYTDPKKVTMALEIAAAIAGWTVFGVPLVQTLILLAWSFAESMIDVSMILQGHDMPIFKLNTDWVLSIEGGAKEAARALTNKMAGAFKNKVVEETKKFVKNKANEAIDYTSDKVAESIEKGITDQVSKVTRGMTESISNSIEQKVEEVLDSAFRPFENAIYTEIGKTEAKFDELKDSLEALNNKASEKYEDAVDGLMEHVNKSIYDSVKKYFPEAERELNKCGYRELIDGLRVQEKRYFEELKGIGIDFLGKKEKELKEKLDEAQEQTIGKIKTAIANAKTNLKKRVLDGINNTLLEKFKAAGDNLSDKIDEIVSKKINSIKNSGKDKIKEKLGSFIDNLGGKSKGSSLKEKTFSIEDYTAKVNIRGNLLKMGYTGYLRLFLLFVSPDKKLKRIQDLVQLNMEKETGKEFRLSDYNTFLRVEAVFSVKYLFMTSAFMPRTYKDRYKISHVVYKGY